MGRRNTPVTSSAQRSFWSRHICWRTWGSNGSTRRFKKLVRVTCLAKSRKRSPQSRSRSTTRLQMGSRPSTKNQFWTSSTFALQILTSRHSTMRSMTRPPPSTVVSLRWFFLKTHKGTWFHLSWTAMVTANISTSFFRPQSWTSSMPMDSTSQAASSTPQIICSSKSAAKSLK